MKKAVVVLGAGASHDAWNEASPRKERWQPPRAKDLFAFNEEFWKILVEYPGALMLQESSLGPASRSATALPLEESLLALSNHPDERIRVRFRQVPAYIRDVVHECAERYLGGRAGAYSGLIHGLLADVPHQVAFVSLNYDTFLERAITTFDPSLKFDELPEYVGGGRQALVVKPHGSTNWFRALARPGESVPSWLAAVEASDPFSLSGQVRIIDDQRHSQHESGAGSGDSYWVYPVITAPLANKDARQLVCPEKHLDALATFMRDCEKYLFIGTSGIDHNVWTFMAEYILPRPSAHYVASGDVHDVRGRIENSIPNFKARRVQPILNADGFRSFVYGPDFEAFLAM